MNGTALPHTAVYHSLGCRGAASRNHSMATALQEAAYLAFCLQMQIAAGEDRSS